MLARFLTVLAMVLSTALVLGYGFPYDQRNGPGIAAHIESLQEPIVSEVRYEPGDFLHGATIRLVLNPGTSIDEAQGFICHVALPYAEAADPPDGLGIAATDGNSTVVATDTPCR